MILQYPLAFGFLVLAFWLMYYILPDFPQHKSQILVGAVIAAALWVIATTLFRSVSAGVRLSRARLLADVLHPSGFPTAQIADPRRRRHRRGALGDRDDALPPVRHPFHDLQQGLRNGRRSSASALMDVLLDGRRAGGRRAPSRDRPRGRRRWRAN